MKTKVVYSLISSERDNYLEQAYLSLLSLREHTKDVEICLLIDEGTKQTGSAFRKSMMESFDEVIVVDIEKKYTNAEKSRYLKTTSRLHIITVFPYGTLRQNILDYTRCGIVYSPNGFSFEKIYQETNPVHDIKRSVIHRRSLIYEYDKFIAVSAYNGGYLKLFY